MKRLFWVAFAMWLSIDALAQGTIILNNRTPSGNVRISSTDGMRGIGMAPEGATAQLFLVPADGGALIPLFPTATFRTNPASSYFVSAVEVSVADKAAGSTAVVILRAWENGNDIPGARWESLPLTVTLGGETAGGEVLPAAPLNGLSGGRPLTPGYTYFNSISRENDQMRLVVSYLPEGIEPAPYPSYLESSGDMKTWQTVTTIQNPPSQKLTVPFIGANGAALFYRVRMDRP